MLKVKERIGDLEIVRIGLKHLGAQTEAMLLAPGLGVAQGRGGVLYDLSNVETADYSGLCALANLYASPHQVGFFGARGNLKNILAQKGLDQLLDISPTLKKALELEWTRKFRLAGRKAVILVAGEGKRCRPLSYTMPKPMLPIMGRPILYHIMGHLSGFGIRDVFLNPGYLGPQISDYFQSGRKFGLRVRYVNEGNYRDGKWAETILGSAASLANIQARADAFDDDFFVLCGDGLYELDLIAMLEQHQKLGAIATVATKRVPREAVHKYGLVKHDRKNRIRQFQEKPHQSEAVSNLANIGVYIFSPKVLDYITPEDGLDIGQHLLPRLIEAGECVGNYVAEEPWIDVGCVTDFFNANLELLGAAQKEPERFGVKWRKNIALAAGAQFMRGAVAKGEVYIGEGAIVRAGARLIGPCFIGSGSIVDEKSFIERSLIMPATHVMRGAYAVDMLVSGTWAVSYTFAKTSADVIEPLEYAQPVADEIASRYPEILAR